MPTGSIVFGAHGKTFASRPCRTRAGRGGRIINVASDGEIVVIADGDSLEVLGRTPLDEETRATPAVADGRLLFRSASHLWALPLDQPLTRSGADGN